MKDQLIFDTTQVAESDNVGAYLRASDGTLLTHTDVGGKKALDVRIAEGINVEIDLSHVDDSVRLGDGTSLFTSTSENGDIALDVHISNTSLAVTATDLDIRDLVFATDKVDVSGSSVALDAGTLAALESITVQNGAGAAAVNIQDGGNSITVDAVQLDIDDLNATDDAVAAWMKDGSGNSIGSTSNALDVYVTGSAALSINDAALANTAITAGKTNVLTPGTPVATVGSILANRKYLYIYNKDNRQMEIGPSGFTDGFPLSPGSFIELRAGAAVSVFYDSPKTNHEIRYMELS